MQNDDAVVGLLVAGGVLTQHEVADLPAGFSSRVRRDPYALTELVSALPPPALRWGWQPERAAAFCQWVETTLDQRFAIPFRVVAEREGAPALLRLQLDGREEIVDWAYLNSARWMGSFCTMAARLLAKRGVEAIEMETGDLDTVVLFCRSNVAEELREVMPIAD